MPSVARFLDYLILGGLLFTAAILPLQTYSFQVSVGMSLVLLTLWGVRAVVKKRATFVWSRLHFTLLAFLGVVLLQLVPLPFQLHPLNFSQSFNDLPVSLDQWHAITLDKRTTGGAATVLASLIGYFFIASNFFDSQERRRQVVNWFIIIGVTISLLGVLDIFSAPGDPLLRGTSFLGFYHYSLQRLTGYMEMIFPLPLAMLLAGGARPGQWVWYGFATIALGVGIALAGSTGAILVLVVELMMFFTLVDKQRSETREFGFRNRSRIRMGMSALVVIGTIVSGVVWLATQSIPQMIEQDVTSNVRGLGQLEEETTTADHYGRAEIWRSSLRMIKAHPLLGVGLGVYPIAYTRHDPSPGTKLVNAAHNDYLQLLCETGLLGGVIMVLFLVFLGQLSRNSLSNEEPLERAIALGAAIGCMAILVHSLVDFHLQNPGTALLFLLLIALLVSVRRIRANHEQSGGFMAYA